MGRMISEQAAIAVEEMVNDAVTAGACLLTGGKRNGAFYAPSMFRSVCIIVHLAIIISEFNHHFLGRMVFMLVELFKKRLKPLFRMAWPTAGLPIEWLVTFGCNRVKEAFVAGIGVNGNGIIESTMFMSWQSKGFHNEPLLVRRDTIERRSRNGYSNLFHLLRQICQKTLKKLK